MTWHHHPTFCLQREIMFLEWSCVEFIQRSKSIQKNSPSSLSSSSFNSNESCFMTSFILQSYPHLQIFKAHHLRRQWGQLLQKLGLRFHSRRRTHRRRPPSSSAPGCRVQFCIFVDGSRLKRIELTGSMRRREPPSKSDMRYLEASLSIWLELPGTRWGTRYQMRCQVSNEVPGTR